MGQVVWRAALGLATAFARYIDNQRKPLRQRELCDWHANKLKASQTDGPRFEGAEVDEKTRSADGTCVR
jgi:hypothetical protein